MLWEFYVVKASLHPIGDFPRPKDASAVARPTPMTSKRNKCHNPGLPLRIMQIQTPGVENDVQIHPCL